MTSVETIPQIDTAWPEPPRLLVEWSSPWEEFRSAVRPALSRSPKRLGGEAYIGLFPYRGLLASWIVEIIVLWLAIVLPERLESLRPYTPPPMPKYDVLYYYGDELPQTQDNAGAEAGRSGLAGGQESHHRTQAIRVARGDRPSDKVVDAPKVNLPRSDSAVANLLAFKPLASPPPTEGLRSSLVAPQLPAASVVPPTPELNSALSRNPNSLMAPVIPPAPEVAHASTRTIAGLNSSVIAPAPDVARDKMRSAIPLSSSVVAPAPTDAQRDLASSRVPVTQTTNVVAPPVSAPQRDVSSPAKLTLPSPAVVAPPPSQVSRDLNSWGGSAVGNIRATPVPPPPSAAGTSQFNARGGIGSLTPQVVPPPVSVAGTSGTTRSRGGVGGLSSQVVPPPVSAGGAGLQGNGNRQADTLLGSADIVPPPPGLGGGNFPSGSGRGAKGTGTGSMLDLGTAAAPPSSKGNAAGSGGAPSAPASGATGQSGVVISSQPGTKVGVPNSGGAGGALAMSPTGIAKTGIGGSGGGTGIGKGTGPGSGLSSDNSGAAKEGTGRGSDPAARAGISPYPGPGGAGRGASGSPPMPGVSVQGGNTITLPSFGPPNGDAPAGPGHSSVNNHKRSGITVVASSRSGGVFNYYGALKGDRVYSIYIDTSLGTAVMQFADPESAAHPYAEDLTAPEPLYKDLPQGIRSTHVVFVGILSRSGEIKDLKVLEPGAAEATSRLLAALPSWKFRPAFRGNDPVEVNVILGFGIDTR